MSITAKVIADSVGPKSPRITTFELRYPRFIHAEFMTHRMFSRNASSSRAIPVERQIQSIIEDTAMPVHWGMNQSGMQADQETDAMVEITELQHLVNGHYADVVEQYTAEHAWLKARDRAIEIAEGFVAAGYHKQVVNRILEPFSHIKVVCTATNYGNFFHLRSHKDAQPEIKVLSDLMMAAYDESTPRLLGGHDWHLPYVTDQELGLVADGKSYLYKPEHGDGNGTMFDIGDLIKFSVARCARVSYDNHDGTAANPLNDIKLYDRLVGSVPLHASPAEHQAKLDNLRWSSADLPEWENRHLSGNFDGGWIQYRKTLEGEVIPTPAHDDDIFDG